MLVSISLAEYPQGYKAKLRENSWICAPMNMTHNEGGQPAIFYQGIRILRSFGWPPLRQQTKISKKRRRVTKTIRRSHGFVRAIEDLRRLRLSLVPKPDSRECLLQGV
jgi:hypothetical protein